VEQTRDVVRQWLKRLRLEERISVSILMGGEESDNWDLYPEREAIIIGTQDMLLSRALNRGYGMSRYRWPMHFGLLNNDCLWVFDEIQLMGSGLATTVQLEAFREGTRGFGANGPVRSIWMSATLDRKWLRTVDFDPGALGSILELRDDDLIGNGEIRKRYSAKKLLRQAESTSEHLKELAAEIIRNHRAGTRTIAILNTVQRAKLLYAELTKQEPKAELLLIHSRFRPRDRQTTIEALLESPPEAGRIVVSTQVIEAGVDVSAQTLFTELAPWASLVQRFGRCNRSGEFLDPDPGRVFWINISGDNKSALPYTSTELDHARTQLQSLVDKNIGPEALARLSVELPFQHTHVVRRKDIIELFDTTPDVAGNDLDIDRFVRDTDDSDVRIFWRNLGAVGPSPEELLPVRDELCPVPIGGFRQFVVTLAKAQHLKVRKAYRRDFLRRVWEPVNERDIFPGQMYLLDSAVGGYASDVGWTGEVAKIDSQPVAIASLQPLLLEEEDSNEADPWSHVEVWQTIAAHTDDVCREVEAALSALNVPQAEALRIAARWHDWGKSHEIFQAAVRDQHPTRGPRPGQWINSREIAKAPGKRKLQNGSDTGWWCRYQRPQFRHELASALAILQLDDAHIHEGVRNLVAYLVAAHHGKVRLSIRSLPGEIHSGTGKRFARGLWDGDKLPSAELGSGVTAPAVVLTLEPMELGCSSEGRPSWAENALGLRDEFGPFRLAFLEALLRAADMRASHAAEQCADSSEGGREARNV
jgi:CRISPR-associated endonuclease/helicase Cas3